jgi:hypothetical protein
MVFGQIKLSYLAGFMAGQLSLEKSMLCKIRVPKETDNPDVICDDWKFCIIDDKDITPNF